MSDAARPTGRRIDAEELLAHAAWLRGLARSLVQDEHAADDVVQETFAAAVSHPPRDRGALRGWLAKVARHAAWKSHRGDTRRAAREQAAPSRGAEPSSSEIVERIETQRALLDAVQALEEPYRTVVMMRFYDGKAPREIARELGVTPEVVWQRLSRAIAMLRARLDARRGGRDAWAGVFVLWVGGRDAAATASAAGAATGSATALGTGAALMGTKTVVAAAAAAALAAWYLWPAPKTEPVDASRESAAIERPSPVERPTVAPRVRPIASNAAPSEPATAAAPRARTHGRVVDAVSGEPIADARVKVVRKSPGGGFRWALTTGADGTFSGEVEETKRYSDELEWSAVHSELFVEASARGHLWFYEGPYRGATGDDLGDIKLARGVVVRGLVVQEDGRPVPGASLYATAGPAFVGNDDALNRARPLGKADDAGRFELDEALANTKADEAFTLFAACREGVAFRSLPVRKGRDVIDDVVLTLRLGGAVVRVVDPDGRPIEGATVTALPRFSPLGREFNRSEGVYSIGGDDLLRATFAKRTGADGTVRFGGLPTAEQRSQYEVAAAADGFVLGWTSLQAGASPPSDVEIRLARVEAFVVGGRVVDADGRPVEGAVVTVTSPKHDPAVSGADGRFVIERGKGETFGRYGYVAVSKEGFATQRDSVWRWPDDGRAMSDIRLERPAPVTGTVLDEDGKPIAGARVALWRPESYVPVRGDGKTSADGRFELLDAVAGDWALAVTPPDDGGRWSLPPEWTVVRGGTSDVVVRLRRIQPGRATIQVSVVDAESGAEVEADAAMLGAATPSESGVTFGAGTRPKIERGSVTIEKVPAGRYALWIRVADRPHQLVRIRVADGEAHVRATCRVRRAVAVSGRVRLPDGVAPADVALECSLAEGAPPYGLPGWGMPVGAPGAKVAADGTFRFDSLTPSVYRVGAIAGAWMGETAIDASEGDAAADLELRRGAVVRIGVPGTKGLGGMRFDVSLDGAPFTRLVNAGIVEGMPFSVPKTLPPGRLQWRATFRASMNPFDPLEAAEPQSGELLLESGKDVEIVVPVVPRK